MSNKLQKTEVEKIAQLANLKLTEKELEKFTLQLEEVIDYNVEKLSKVDTEKVAPLLNISGLENALREDETTVDLTQEKATQNGSSLYDGFFKVKQILEQ